MSVKLRDVARRQDLRVHFIGQLQSKKATSVVRYADVVQSVDRPKLVTSLESAAASADRVLDVLVQVNHLRTHPAVAAALATRSLALHGWFFDLHHGAVLAYDGSAERFMPLADTGAPPVAVPPRAAGAAFPMAAE